MVDKATLTKGQLLVIILAASDEVPILINGQPATAASLGRNDGGDLQIHIEGLAAPEAPVQLAPLAEDAPPAEAVVERTDALDLQTETGEAGTTAPPPPPADLDTTNEDAL